jgi:ribosomal-protein-alanine N-acetyltransferase
MRSEYTAIQVDLHLGKRESSRGCGEGAFTIPGVNIRLRDFRREDFDTLWRLDQACFPPGIAYKRLELGGYIRLPGAITLVAEEHRVKTKSFSATPSTTLGFIIAQARHDGSGHVITIDVAADARRKGMGSLLLKAAEERLKAAKCTRVTLETMVTNTTAIRFYERHGYETGETVTGYYSDGTDALMMEKDLLFSPVPQ